MNTAIEKWHSQGVIDDDTANRLKNNITPDEQDYNSLSFYAFIASVSCALLAFGALVLDEKWIERLRKFFEFSEFLIGSFFALVTAFLIGYARRRWSKYPLSILANESFCVLIALSAGITIVYLARATGVHSDNYGFPVLVAAIVFGLSAAYLGSKLLWIAMLIAIISAWGTLTWSWSSMPGRSYFLGMNYPLRMVIFGLALLGAGYLLTNNRRTARFYLLHQYSSLVFFLVSGLVLSTSGNTSYEVWAAIRQGKLVVWALAYTVLLIGLLYYAFRHRNEQLRDIVIIFFLLNIYTRYFEYFWDKTNKGIFFALLALSFWWLGKKAETIRRKLSANV